jgi:hypothetical protein
MSGGELNLIPKKAKQVNVSLNRPFIKNQTFKLKVVLSFEKTYLDSVKIGIINNGLQIKATTQFGQINGNNLSMLGKFTLE